MTQPRRADGVGTVAPVMPAPAHGEAPVDAGPTGGAGLGRAALGISAWNALSRLTGFVRVLAVGGALGATYLGNTYHSANLVSTITFELLAAGLLAAPLVPAFVRLLDGGRPGEAERLAGALLGVTLAALGALALAMALAGPALMRLLTAGVDDPAVRAREVRLGAFFLWFFLPQMLLYAAGAVATALLNARRRFAAAAFAPVANNVVVTLTMLGFVAVTSPGERGLGLGTGPAILLAVGTTAGVVAMAAVPVAALARAGIRLRPRLDPRHPGLGALARAGAWGVLLLAAVQVLLAVTLVLANGVEGGVVAHQIAFTFFLLPFALVAHPVFTALHPRLSSAAAAGRWDDFGTDLGQGLGRMLTLVLPAAALLAALASPVLDLVRVGELDAGDAALVGRVLAAYAVGLGGYAAFQLLVRAATAAGDARLPALVGLGVAAGGVVAMVAGSAAASGTGRVVALGLAHSAAMTAGAFVMYGLLRRRVPPAVRLAPAVGRAVAAAAAVAAVAAGGASLVGGGGRAGALADVAVAGPLAVAAGAGVLWVLRSPELAGVAGRLASRGRPA
jgi:putative peptidoglycan lipid II flippase